MTDDELLDQAVRDLKAQPEDVVFEALKRIFAIEFGWELSRRDPGPCTCGESELDIAGIAVHRFDGEPCYMRGQPDIHVMSYQALTADLLADPDPKANWTDEQIRQATTELRSLRMLK